MKINLHNPRIAAAIKIDDEAPLIYPVDFSRSGMASKSGGSHIVHLARRNSQLIRLSHDRSTLQKAGHKEATTMPARSPRAPISQNHSLESSSFNIVVGKPVQPLKNVLNMNILKATQIPQTTKPDTTDATRFQQHSLIGGNLILKEGHSGIKLVSPD